MDSEDSGLETYASGVPSGAALAALVGDETLARMAVGYERVAQAFGMAVISGQLMESATLLIEPALTAPTDDDAEAQRIVARGQKFSLSDSIKRVAGAADGRLVLPDGFVDRLTDAKARRNRLAHDFVVRITFALAGDQTDELIAELEADRVLFEAVAAEINAAVYGPALAARGVDAADFAAMRDGVAAVAVNDPARFKGVQRLADVDPVIMTIAADPERVAAARADTPRSRPPGAPHEGELEGMVTALVREIRDGLNRPEWTVLNTSDGQVQAYTGAALWHACELLRYVDDARRRDDEYVTRILARSLLETWVVGMYLCLGGRDALDALGAQHRHAYVTQDRAMLDQRDRILSQQTKANASNEAAVRHNQKVTQWNTAHPDNPQRLWDIVEVPAAPPPLLDMLDEPGALPGVEPAPLSLRDMAGRVDRHLDGTPDQNGFETTYNYMYRTLSTLGAHPTLAVLDSYLNQPDSQPDHLRVVVAPDVDSFGYASVATGLTMVAGFAIRLLGGHGHPTPVAVGIRARFEDANAEPVTTTDG